MAAIADRVKQSSTTTGSGAVTLTGAVAGFRTFDDAFGVGVPCHYAILDANGTAWEVGVGELTDSTHLTRTTVEKSSNANAAIVLTAGTHAVFSTLSEGWADTKLDVGVPSALADIGTPGTYKSVTTDSKGRVTAGTNPTTLAGYGITDAVNTSALGAASGVATLDSGGKLTAAQVPAIAVTDTFVVASQAAQTALTAEVGDVAVRTDLNKSYILKTSPASTFANWEELRTPTDVVLSVNGMTGAVTVSTVTGNAGTATALATARNIDGQAFDGTANVTVIAPGTHAATSKATPVDADEVPLVDSAASNVLKKLTWANLKATLKTYFDTLYPSGSGTSSGTNTGDQTILLTGNVTGSGTGSFAATIANDAVTYAKMQNVSATDKVLGRSTAGAGDVEEITCTAAGRALIDDADAAAQRTTLGLGTLATQSGTFSGTSSGTNTGDQTSIVGITGTIAQFNTAVTDADLATLGANTHTGAQTAPSFIPNSATVPANGMYLPAANTVAIATNSTERMRVDSSGTVMIGTTAADPIASGVGGFSSINGYTRLSQMGDVTLLVNRGTNDGATAQFFRSGGLVGNISVTTTATAYNTSSDRRLKNNIADAPDAGGIVDAIRVRAFDWKSTGEHVNHGFVAQELLSVAPQAVSVGDDGDEIADAWSVDPSKLVPLLMKEIQSLRMRVAALENR